jgi:hypothetical protein
MKARNGGRGMSDTSVKSSVYSSSNHHERTSRPSDLSTGISLVMFSMETLFLRLLFTSNLKVRSGLERG